MSAKPRLVRLFESTVPSGNAYKVQLAASMLGLSLPSVELDILAAQPGYVRMRPDPLGKKPTFP